MLTSFNEHTSRLLFYDVSYLCLSSYENMIMIVIFCHLSFIQRLATTGVVLLLVITTQAIGISF